MKTEIRCLRKLEHQAMKNLDEYLESEYPPGTIIQFKRGNSKCITATIVRNVIFGICRNRKALIRNHATGKEYFVEFFPFIVEGKKCN